MLSETDAKKFWAERAHKHQAQAVGFDAGANAKKNDAEYEERFDFVFQHLLHASVPTLDYGCGVGRYAHHFPNYLGLDATGELLTIAKGLNPSKNFQLIEGVYPSEEEICRVRAEFKPERIFTATVLQHCSDDLVVQVLRSLLPIDTVVTFALYEKDNGDTKPHVISRRCSDYYDLLNRAGWFIKDYKTYSHKIHKEIHTLSVFSVG